MSKDINNMTDSERRAFANSPEYKDAMAVFNKKMKAEAKLRDSAYPAVFPECGCHYTTSDDGIHFCPVHNAAHEMYEVLKEILAVEGRLMLPDWALLMIKSVFNKANTPYKGK